MLGPVLIINILLQSIMAVSSLQDQNLQIKFREESESLVYTLATLFTTVARLDQRPTLCQLRVDSEDRLTASLKDFFVKLIDCEGSVISLLLTI